MARFENIIAITNKMETPDFVCFHERADMYLLTIFQSNILFSYNGTHYFSCPKNSVIVYSPEQLQAYKSHDSFFLNSFLGFLCDSSLFTGYTFPLNRIFTVNTEDLNKILKILDEISFTLNTNYFVEKKHLIPSIIVSLFKTLEKAYHTSVNSIPSKNVLFNAREDLLTNPIENPVNVLAQKLGYNLSYFCEIYKKQFNISPGQERKKQIVQIIKKYLETTNYSLEKITELCKISNTPALIKMFKQCENLTPHQYRIKFHQTTEKTLPNDMPSDI